MRKLAFLLAFALGCDPAPAPPAPAPVPPAPPAPSKPEPERIVVQHILVSFAGAPRAKATRSKAEAEKLATELLDRVKKGEAFEELMKRYSDDPGPGEYGMANNGVTPGDPQKEFPRKGMVPAFGNVGFQLGVGDIGLAVHHEKDSPFGWHIIKRVK
jgi:parvulin-like peptidyl-prolyl isomerase